MFKKTILVALGTMLVSGLVFGRSIGSYLTTSVSCVQESVRDSVPITFELERARKMISDIQPEVRQNMHRIAKEEVEINRLTEQLKKMEARQAKNQHAIMRLKSDLESGSESFVYAGSRTYTVSEVRSDLANRFERFKTVDETVRDLSKTIRVRQAGLASARQQLDELLSSKKQLQLDVEGLEARRKMLEVHQTASDFQFDGSQLARTKDLVNNIRTRLDVTEKLLDATTELVPEIEVDVETSGDLLEQVANYFSPQEELPVERLVKNSAH